MKNTKLNSIQKKEIYNFIYNYKTKYLEGFMPDELTNVLKKFPNINMSKYSNAMMGNTCIMYEDKFCMYHCDVYNAIICGLEDRELTLEEWD